MRGAKGFVTSKAVRVGGNTYPHRQFLKATGFKWDPTAREWVLQISTHSEEEKAKARAVIAALTDVGIKVTGAFGAPVIEVGVR